ncbi:MAG: Sulfite oxidase [Microgenomates group bacterium Gr01-1014_5]|nr:MAG: Sulfite oxidase [Microgenomates group bacterium Gr01-1014_5]
MHQYHWDKEKHAGHRFLDAAVPLGLLLAFYLFYNNGVISPREAVKTTGLWSVSLLALTLAVGPLAKLLPLAEHLKAHRKVWGVTAFWAAVLHVGLVFHFFWKWDLSRLWDIANPKYNGIATGLLALIILGLVTYTSQEKIIKKMNPHVWKTIQTTSYLALILAVLHFFYMEQKDGVLVIKKLLGQVVFWGSLSVIAARLLIIFLPEKK